MDRRMEDLLTHLKQQLLRMSALAETMIADALRVLSARTAEPVDAVERHEQEVNALQVEIDEVCLNLIALHQPTAGDLRFILGAAKTNAELERLADQAVNVMQKAARFIQQPTIEVPPAIPRMAGVAVRMVKDALHAYVTRNSDRAREVLTRDDEVDDLKRSVTTELVQQMRRDPACIERALDLVLIARNVERIGDHATNIAENAIFLIEGRDVRHHAEEKAAQGGG